MNLKNGISVVICTYNGVKRLQPTLEAIFSQEVAPDIPWELIIVDNASTDKTAEFCENLIQKKSRSQQTGFFILNCLNSFQQNHFLRFTE